jgi:hypothetical protein
MIRTSITVFFSVFLLSCELIVIGTPPQQVKPIEIDRSTGVGAAMLFKEEIDTNNIQAAAEIIDLKPPQKLKAIGRYDLYYDLIATKNVIDDREITAIIEDTLSQDEIDIILELNYTKRLFLKTFLRDSLWYIQDLSLD